MFFLKGKEDMGLDASLNLLDLSPNATIDDANQAYTYFHRMIDLFHRDNDTHRDDRQEDLELLACAYEKAVSYLSDQDSRLIRDTSSPVVEKTVETIRSTTDIHFTINFPGAPDDQSPADEIPSVPASDTNSVQDAIALISRRLQEAESALGEARAAVDAATEALAAANQRLEETRQRRMEAMIAAKAAKSRAVLMEIEAKRATEEALAVAEKVRDRVETVKQAAEEARLDADNAQDRIREVVHAEEMAAADAVCAEDCLEAARERLRTLTHTVVEARNLLRFVDDHGAHAPQLAVPSSQDYRTAQSGDLSVWTHLAASDLDIRQRMLSDLMDIEDSLSNRKQRVDAIVPDHSAVKERLDTTGERRRHERLRYPTRQRPLFSFDGRTIPVMDLSQTGMGLEPDDAVGQSHLVRGAILFNGLPTMNVTGRVVRRNAQGLGLRLVTRIGNHILDRERMRLSA